MGRRLLQQKRELAKILKAQVEAEYGVTIEFNPDESKNPILDLILEIFRQGQENGWPLLTEIISQLLKILISI